MTHDELLDAVYWYWRKDARGDGLQPMVDYRGMVLAVVQLHKPQPTTIPSDPKCAACSGLDWCDYPCPTIQAIEKVLNG